MSGQVTNYKCPACTGPMYYDGENDRLQCDYCGSSYTVSEIESLLAKKSDNTAEAVAENVQETEGEDVPAEFQGEFESVSGGQHWGEGEGVTAYNCPSCGAELVCDETAAALSCPYCDNPTIIPASVADILKPDMIIPFKVKKEEAKAALRQHFKGKPLLPKVFSDENHIDEIKGVYVPFWLFDADVHADYAYSGTKIRTWYDRDYKYTETSLFHLERSGSIRFENVPVDGSKQMDDTLMESIEPFDQSEAVEFKNAYLAGYYANRYDVNAEDNRKRAYERIESSVKKEFAETIGAYTSLHVNRANVQLGKNKAWYAFYPVWILNTTWRGEKYVFAMNGQTGKFVGDLPVDNSLRWKWHGIYSAGIAAVCLLVRLLMQLL